MIALVLSLILCFIVLVLTLSHIYDEINEMMKLKKHYFKLFWNYIDIPTYLFSLISIFFFAIILLITNENVIVNLLFKLFNGISILFLWIKFLGFGRANISTFSNYIFLNHLLIKISFNYRYGIYYVIFKKKIFL